MQNTCNFGGEHRSLARKVTEVMIHPIRTLDHIPNFVKTEFKICLQKNRRKLEAIIEYCLRADRKVVVIEGRYRNLIIIKSASILPA